jgi:hypothetical protein
VFIFLHLDVTEPFDFVSQMQIAALEIRDHQIISRAMEQSVANLIFEGLVPPFKINNMGWFRHESLRIHAWDCSNEMR